MDPQSQSFTPYSSANETWRLQTDVARVQQVQAEHAERIARLERRQDEDARVKSVWGNQSPFPSVLSGGPGGTPNQGPINPPPSDHFQGFDDEANTLMNSLTNLDAEDEPRRALGATSRANSVRFDETANQNHFSHSSRPSMDLSRSSSGGLVSGLGGLQMNERSSSHKSEGRASSAHSMRSTTSGRANSMNMESAIYGLTESKASLPDPPAIAPGVLLMGYAPAIVRCWMTMEFKHSAQLYAAVCTGSHKSYVHIRQVIKMKYQDIIRAADDGGAMTIGLPVYFPEATQQPPARRLGDTNLPYLQVDFTIVGDEQDDNDDDIQIFFGSDMLRAHNADILLSSNTLTLYDYDRHKLSIPLVRPENEAAFKKLHTTSGTASASPHKKNELVREQATTNGLGRGSSAASISSGAASPHPTSKPNRPPGLPAPEQSSADSVKGCAAPGSDTDLRPASRQSNASRPSLNLNTARSEVQDSPAQPSEATSTTPLRSGSSPAIWSNWRRDAPSATPTAATPTATTLGMDWSSSSRNREGTYQRRETGMRVLKPKTASRAFSSTATPAPGDGGGGGSAKSSRFFDDGRRKSEVDTKSAEDGGEGAGAKKGDEPSTDKKTKKNPIGAGSAFRWM